MRSSVPVGTFRSHLGSSNEFCSAQQVKECKSQEGLDKIKSKNHKIGMIKYLRSYPCLNELHAIYTEYATHLDYCDFMYHVLEFFDIH